jgi:hypothetical protein
MGCPNVPRGTISEMVRRCYTPTLFHVEHITVPVGCRMPRPVNPAHGRGHPKTVVRTTIMPMARLPKIEPAPFVTRRRTLQGALAVAASSLLPGCGSSLSPSTGSSPPGNGNAQPTPSGPIASASLMVTAATTGVIGSSFAGLSYEKSSLYESPYLFTGSNANLIALFKLLGTSILRIGGNSVDRNVWTPNGAGQTEGQIAPADVNALAAFLQATGWKCLYGINLGGAGPNPYTSGSIVAATSSTLAAEEIAYVYETLGASLFGFEIGNECDLYGSSYFSGATWNLSTFEALWSEYRAAIVAKTPAVAALCTGPADAGSESSWTVPFGQYATKSNISLLTQHYYRGNGQSATSTAANLITPDSTLMGDLATLDSGAQGVGVPYRLSECNSYYNGGADGVSDAYCSSLWVVDFLFNNVQGGSVGTNFHGGGDGDGYTPIADSGGAVVEARPEYYGMLFFTLSGQGTLLTTSPSSDIAGLNATAYAVKTSSGALNIVVVNKDNAQNLEFTISLPQAASSATLLEMTQLTSGASGPNISATSGVTIQGASVGANGSFSPGPAYTLSASGSQLTCYVPYSSAVLIQVS